MTTCDPGDIYETIDLLVQENIKVSIISLSAEVYICKAIAEKTGGNYGVCLNEDHFHDLIHLHCSPPPANAKMDTMLIRMGFPDRQDFSTYPSLCAW